MMKTTQFLTNIKLWQGIFFSFLLLVSLNLNSQNVGDDLLASSNGQVDTSSETLVLVVVVFLSAITVVLVVPMMVQPSVDVLRQMD